MRTTLLSSVVLVLAASAAHAAAPVTVVMDRAGMTLEDGTEIPAYGGSTRRWNQVVACVQRHFEPFNVEIVETAPTNRPVIRALVGGTPDLIGLTDDTTTGLSPYTGEVIPSALVYVFSQTIGESNVEWICATAAHEIGHSLGLDHSNTCGDLMSYHGEECGAPTFMTTAGPCGEYQDRACANGQATQSSFHQIAANVGLRGQAPLAPIEADDEVFDPADPEIPWSTESDDELDEPTASFDDEEELVGDDEEYLDVGDADAPEDELDLVTPYDDEEELVETDSTSCHGRHGSQRRDVGRGHRSARSHR